MKNFKKLHKGMTLVEVIVAMSIFSIGAAAVTMAFSAAVKYNTQNQRRDEELSVQQTALQSGKSSAIEVYNGYKQSNEIVFTDTKTSNKISFTSINPYKHVTEYQAARSGKNDTIYDFQLKTFSTTPLGADTVVWNKAENKFKFSVVNQTGEPVDVRIVSDGGVFYLGDYSSGGYKHSSDVYWHTLAAAGSEYDVKSDPTKPDSDPAVVVTSMAPSGFEVGYVRDDMATLTSSPIKFLFYKEGFVYAQADLEVNKLLNCNEGWCSVVIDDAHPTPILTYVD